MSALRERFPALAERVEKFPAKDSIVIFTAQDGSVCYGIRQGNKLVPVMDHLTPMAGMKKQIDDLAKELSDLSRTVLIVGLYPGNELLGIFDLCENARRPHPEQQINVCIDSTICLYAFLKTWNAAHILRSDRVNMFWHEDMPQFVRHLKERPEIPHIFTLITGAKDATLNKILPPLAQLVAARNSEAERLKKENNAYYDAISDAELARIIGNSAPLSDSQSQPSALNPPRRPRLMMPTCNWSTYVQHSTRDTCAAFEDMGWETRILRMDAMLTPYYLVKAINEFKPDVFLFINHMRYEAEKVYPKNMMFATWVQDEMSNLQCKKAGEKLAEYAARAKRDLVIGYVNELDTRYGYPKDRLVPLNITANPRIFHPVELTAEDHRKYGCDLAFMTNTSMPSEQVVEQMILPVVEPLGISRATCMQIHDDLWKLYRAGDTLTDRTRVLEWLMQYPGFAEAWRKAQGAEHSAQGVGASSLSKDDLFRLFYWRLNDTIYRHVVLEWAVELAESSASSQPSVQLSSSESVPSANRSSVSQVSGFSPHPPVFRLHLYGLGWENHPRFAKYARGPLAHGPELNKAYQAARHCLHLNISPGMHQRIHEIIASGASILIRTQQPPDPIAGEPPRELMRRLASAFRMHRESMAGATASFDPFSADICRTPEEKEALTDWVFSIAFSLAKQEAVSKAETPAKLLESRVMERIQSALESRLDWHLENWEKHIFSERQEFKNATRSCTVSINNNACLTANIPSETILLGIIRSSMCRLLGAFSPIMLHPEESDVRHHCYSLGTLLRVANLAATIAWTTSGQGSEDARIKELMASIEAAPVSASIRIQVANILLSKNLLCEAETMVADFDFRHHKEIIHYLIRRVVSCLSVHDFDSATKATLTGNRWWRNANSIIQRIPNPQCVVSLSKQLPEALYAIAELPKQVRIATQGRQGLRARLTVMRAIQALDHELSTVPFTDKRAWFEACGNPFPAKNDKSLEEVCLRYAAMCAWHSLPQLAKTLLSPPARPASKMLWYEAYVRASIAYTHFGFESMAEFAIGPKWPFRYATHFLNMVFYGALHCDNAPLASTTLNKLRSLYMMQKMENQFILRIMTILSEEVFETISADSLSFLKNLPLNQMSPASILQILPALRKHNLFTQAEQVLTKLGISSLPMNGNHIALTITRIFSGAITPGTPLYSRISNILQGATWEESLLARPHLEKAIP